VSSRARLCEDQCVTLAEALAHYNVASGHEYVVCGGFRHGEVGATLVAEKPSGRAREAIAKWHYPIDAGDRAELSAARELVELLRGRGAPLPACLGTMVLADGMLVLQERLPGSTGDDVSANLVKDVVAQVALQERAAHADALTPLDDSWARYVRRSLTVGLTGYCEHGSLASGDERTRALLKQVHNAGASLAHVALEERDAVHCDLHHLNILTQDGRLTGVVDCDGMRTGDRVFDLVTFAFCLSEARRPAASENDIWSLTTRLRDPAIITAYVAHMALRQVDWSLRRRTPADVTRWLDRSAEIFQRSTS
jgi:aminoglycoside phosphotransferase